MLKLFIIEYPDTDYILDEGVYAYYNKNRVPFYKVLGYEDLSYMEYLLNISFF